MKKLMLLVLCSLILVSCSNKAELADEYRNSFITLANQISDKMEEISVALDDASIDTSLYQSSNWKTDLYSDIDRITDLLNQAKALDKPEGFAQTTEYLQKSIDEWASFSSITKESINTLNTNKFSNAYPHLLFFNDYIVKAINGLADQ